MISASLGPQVTTLKSKHILLSLPKLESRTALVLVTSHNLLYYDKTFNIVVAQAKNSPLLLRVWRARVVELERQQHQEERVDVVLGGSRQGGKLVEVAEGATCRRCTWCSKQVLYAKFFCENLKNAWDQNFEIFFRKKSLNWSEICTA